MGLYADENFPLRTVEELRRLGHDVLTALEDGRANQSIPDEDLLARATEIGRTLLTINRLDFKRLHRQMPDHAGIIICTEDPGSRWTGATCCCIYCGGGRVGRAAAPRVSPSAKGLN